MADIKAALRMEAEAMQKMKKEHILTDSCVGIVNPVCTTNFNSRPTTARQIKQATPDLMSFNEEVSKHSADSNWTTFEEPRSENFSSTHSSYSATVQNVMSMFDTNERAGKLQTSPFHQPSVQWSSAPPNVVHQSQSSVLSPFNPELAQPNVFTSYSVQTTGQSTGNIFQRSHSPVLFPPSAGIAAQLRDHTKSMTRNHSHPVSLSAFGQSSRSLDQGLTNAIPWNSHGNNDYKISPTVQQKDFSEASSVQVSISQKQTSLLHSPSAGPKEVKPKSTNSLEREKMNSVFEDWFNDKQTNLDNESPSPKEVTSETEAHWLEWDPLAEKSSSGISNEDRSVEQSSTRARVVESKTSTMQDQNFKEKHLATSLDQYFLQNEATDSSQVDGMTDISTTSDLDNFLNTVESLRASFNHEDQLSNPGHVIGQMVSENQWGNEHSAQVSYENIETRCNATVRVSVIAEGIQQPVTFECDVHASVEHIVSQALCIAYEDISLVSAEDYSFRVVGRQEYLLSKTQLSSYQYVQDCCKYEQDVKLELLHKSLVDHSLQRTADDDKKITMRTEIKELLGKPDGLMTREDLHILLDAYYKESEKLITKVKEYSGTGINPTVQQQCDRVVQSVKAMCAALGNIQTKEITEKLKLIRSAINRPTSPPGHKPSFPAGAHDLVGIETSDSSPTYTKVASPSRSFKVRQSLETLTSVLLEFCEMYCLSYDADFYSLHPDVEKKLSSSDQVLSTDVKDLYSVQIVSLHRIPKTWETTYEEFYAACSLWHGEQQVTHKPVHTKPGKISEANFPRIVWNNWLEFDLPVFDLPLEVILRVAIYGSTANSSDDKAPAKCLYEINIPLFTEKRVLRNDCRFFGMWKTVPPSGKAEEEYIRPLQCFDDITNSAAVVLRVNFSEDKSPSKFVRFPRRTLTTCNGSSDKNRSRSSLSNFTPNDLESAVKRAKSMAGALLSLSHSQREVLWNQRDTLACPDGRREPVVSLPILLRCVPSWSPSSEHSQAAYELMAHWPQKPRPEESLALLTAGFPDSYVRSFATRWLEGASDTDITSWLPQLVQALRFEQRDNSPLSRLLLRRGLGSTTIAHKLLWLLHDNKRDPVFGRRYRLLQAAFLASCGAALKKEFDKELYCMKMINRVAETVKTAKDSAKAAVLTDDLRKVSSRIGGNKFRVPTNPSLVVNGVNVENSSHFTSNAVPIKVAFTNSDPTGSEVNIMYKVGDDLRQDALTMQLIRVMDRMWLAEGLDLRMITFECLPTGPNEGMVELISDSRTLREIQSSYGLSGAFEDRPIAEWLQKYNPTGISYERAIENFTLSCAGYCVATYVLGICDRHNDNIMLRKTGHLFHIDFGKFLGNSQMFGNVKRDRVPFVLTKDMAYAINGGPQPSSRFQFFVDICCRAYNIVRKHSHVLINLLSLMLNCGIPELSVKSDLNYVYEALRPNATEDVATMKFTALIDSSLSSTLTRLNFLAHTLAQRKYHSSDAEEDRRTLSFAPQLRSYKEEDGIIISAEVVGFQKRYSPEKYYLFCVKVTREKLSTRTVDSYVYRTFVEFEELHRKLNYVFPYSLPAFPKTAVVGRSQVKQVAEQRKEKLSVYLRHLLKSKRSIHMHDLIYTFFEPILRDEEKDVIPNLKSPALVGGEIKVSLHYKNSALYIMVMHCRNLYAVNGTDPDPYVKTYLLPDPNRETKKKTKVARKTLNPTYNEMLIYKLPLDKIKRRSLQIGVWNYETIQENDFMGGVCIDLSSIDVTVETASWYRLSSSTL